jgi:hypothetical protein
MSDEDAKGLLALMEIFERGLQLNADSTEKIADEIMRLRAWEAILYLFFSRYYSVKDDPIRAAAADRDFLTNQYREHAKSEEGAQQVEGIYKTLATLIEAGQRYKATLSQEDVADPPEHVN